MNSPPNRQAELRRMEDALRQTRHQLAMIERQITARMTAIIPRLVQRRSGYRRGRPREAKAFLARYRSNLAAITAERQPEIDALSRKLARQEAAIAALRAHAPLPCGSDRDELQVGGIDRRSRLWSGAGGSTRSGRLLP